MPHADIHPYDLPVAFPPPTDFASVGDVDAVPYVSDKGRALYRRFLTLSLPRAFVVAPNGMAASTDGGLDPIGRALVACRKAGTVCRVYAVDDRVVWTERSARVAAPIPVGGK
jgi:hypothetical protein